MELDWSAFGLPEKKTEEIAEALEDPFSIRLLPESGQPSKQSRFFCLGKSLSGQGWFIVYSSTGKQFRVIACRPMTEEEDFYYQRKLREAL